MVLFNVGRLNGRGSAIGFATAGWITIGRSGLRGRRVGSADRQEQLLASRLQKRSVAAFRLAGAAATDRLRQLLCFFFEHPFLAIFPLFEAADARMVGSHGAEHAGRYFVGCAVVVVKRFDLNAGVPDLEGTFPDLTKE